MAASVSINKPCGGMDSDQTCEENQQGPALLSSHSVLSGSLVGVGLPGCPPSKMSIPTIQLILELAKYRCFSCFFYFHLLSFGRNNQHRKMFLITECQSLRYMRTEDYFIWVSQGTDTDCPGLTLTWRPLGSHVLHTGLSRPGTSGPVVISRVRPAWIAGTVIRTTPGLGCGLEGTEQWCIFRGECRWM